MNAPQNTIAYDVDSGVCIVWNGGQKFELWHLEGDKFEPHSRIDADYPIEDSKNAMAYAYANLYNVANPIWMARQLERTLREVR